jgi:CubicO group peptidase (beta-lactamase class C family)
MKEIEKLVEQQTKLIEIIHSLLLYEDKLRNTGAIDEHVASYIDIDWLCSLQSGGFAARDDWLSVSLAYTWITAPQSVYHRSAAGCLSLDSDNIATIDTRYNIASITKFIIVNIVCHLIDRCQLRLDDNVTNYCQPKIPNVELLTIKHLLNHSSGLYDNINFYSAGQPLSKIITMKYYDSPGKKFVYANCNYVLMAMVLESIYGLSLTKIVDEILAKPLGLKHTGMIDENTPEYPYAQGYKYIKALNALIPAGEFYIWGASNIRSTPSDLVTIMRHFFTNNDYVSEATRNYIIASIREVTFEFQDKQDTNRIANMMGYGIEQQTIEIGSQVYNLFCISGWQDSHIAYLAYHPGTGLVFAITCSKTQGFS